MEKMNIAEKCGLVRFSKKYIQKARKFILELAEFIRLLRVFLLLGKNRFNNIKIQDADKQYHFHPDTSNSLLNIFLAPFMIDSSFQARIVNIPQGRRLLSVSP